ncbi:MAG: hypothetical protein MHPSP_003052, partial [Paramarteilia canceri]
MKESLLDNPSISKKSFLTRFVLNCFKNNFIVPKHLAIVPDGNRRFYKANSLDITELEIYSQSCAKVKINLCICYSGIEQMKQAALQTLDSQSEIDNKTKILKEFEKNLNSQIPPVDLLIRTGYHDRLSDFVPHQ